MSLEWFDQELKKKRLILITGKGGIGKTLVAAVLAKRAAKIGLRVLVVEQSSVGQLGPLLGVAEVGHEEKWTANLGVANFTAGGNFRDFITKHLMKSGLLEILISNKIVHSFFTAIPGFSELMLLGRLYYAINLAPRKPDVIIVDCYASGHFLSLMTTPDAVLNSGLAGPISQQTQKVRSWLANGEQCEIFYVATPEELVLSEAVDFLPILALKSPVKLGVVIMNRCFRQQVIDDGVPGSAASGFLSKKIKSQKRSLDSFNLIKSENALLKTIKTICLPEVGAIEEPLSDLLVEEILQGSKDNE